MDKYKAKVIALYLPQFHPTPDNDKWWGEGFTEWTNVAKAKKLYRNHYQPRIPANLGFYDLRLPEVREKQVEIAKRAGVSAFCYYHYWFGNGKEELEKPFKEVVASGKPDFPFCLCWANEPWYSKMWNQDGSIEKKLLVDQVYPGKEDNEQHFYSLLDAFKDKRYLRIHDKLVFMIYKPLSFPKCNEFMVQWNELAVEKGLGGFHFVAHCQNPKSQKDIDVLLSMGFDAVNVLRLNNYVFGNHGILNRVKNYLFHRLLNRPYINDYKKFINKYVGNEDVNDNVYPSVFPNWDHTPRSGRGGYLYENCEPELFEKHCRMVIDEVKDKPEEDRIIFLKSWNEWGEGNYMEPDLRYGYGYIDALKRALTE
jgi:hypothetical protein